MKHFVQNKDFLEAGGSLMIWLWRNSPGKPENKVIWETLKNLPPDMNSLLGKTVSQITTLSMADHASGHTIKVNSPNCFVSWFHMEMGCRCTASPSHKAEFGPSPQFTDLAVSTSVTPSLCTTHWPLEGLGFRSGRAGKFSRNISNPLDMRLHHLFCSQNYFFLFLFTGFKSLMKDVREQIVQCKVDDALQCFLNTFMSWYSRKLPIIILIPLGLNSRRIN